jgi:protein TonB
MGSRLDPARRRPGPALRKVRLPWAAIGVSAIGHVVFFGALALLLAWSASQQSKVHVVNLVPAIAALGHPSAPPTPALPARAAVPVAQRPAPAEPREVKEAPQREARALPEPSLPAQRLPARPAAAVRPGEKELPPLGSTGRERTAPPGESRPPAPAASLGQPTGSPSGVGALSLNVSDFPYAWYLRQILQKVEGQWQRQPQIREPEQKPLVFVEIQRDGTIRPPRIEKSSGNPVYDQAALRAVLEASPFPPLPEDWDKPTLRVIFRFDVRKEHG